MTRFDTDPIEEIASGYRGSQILLTANRLGLFAALGRRELSAEALAEELAADLRGTRILADALVAMDLLLKRNRRYRNSSLALEYLLPDSPRSKQALLHHTAKLYERWGKLFDTVRSGRPVADDLLDPRLLSDARGFAEAMADVGRQSARLTAQALDLSSVRRLLDVGGGPGLYAIEFAACYGQLEAVVLDSRATLEVTRGNIRNADLEGRVTVRAGDAFEDDLGGPYDFVFASNLIHIFSAEENRRLLSRCVRALQPGGRLAIKDFLLDSDRTSPRAGALFAVNMLVSTAGGECYTVDEVQGWLVAEGLSFERVVDITAQSRLILARKAQ